MKINQIISINYGLVYSNDFVSMFDANERKRERERERERETSQGNTVAHRLLVSISMRSDLTCH